MTPAGGESSGRIADLVTDLNIWVRADGTGKVFDASIGFILPNSATVRPDASWILGERWNALPADQRQRLPAIVPDFVAELRFPSDRLGKLQRKMRQYVEQGVRLGWLLDPIRGKAEIYRPGRAVAVLDRPATLAGEKVLPGFVLDLRGILDDGGGNQMIPASTDHPTPVRPVQPTRPALVLPRGVRLKVTPEQFWEFCRANPDLRLERSATGRLIAMTPAGFGSGRRNSKLAMRLGNWAEADGTGVAADSSGGFTLPNGAIRGPDAAWVSQARLALVPPAQLERFPELCPDFVVELRSPSDRLKSLRRKLVEYVEQGVRLGWLLDPIRGKAEIYRPGQRVQVLDRPLTLSGEEVLPGFVLDLRGES